MPTTPEEVQAWFARRVPMVLPPKAIELLDRWRAELQGEAPPSIPGWRPEGPGRTPKEAQPLIAFLRECAKGGEPFTFNALWLEKQGGRSYPFWIVSYHGPVTVSKRAYQAASEPGRRLMLSAIRRDVRAALRAPPDCELLELDFRSCHAAIGVALSGDEQLAADVARDIHQVIGDLAFGSLGDAALRRGAGKALNNSMFFGATAMHIRELTQTFLGRAPRDSTGRRAWGAWWARYPGLTAFRDRVRDLVRQAQEQRQALVIEAPSGRVSRFDQYEVLGLVAKPGEAPPGPDGVWRTVFSACFRAVEGDLFHQTLRHLQAASAGMQVVLPLYDGALLAAPAGAEEVGARVIIDAAERASRDLGLHAMAAKVKRR